MENAEFIAQMAQFSTVTGITEISESLKGMSNQLSEFRIAQRQTCLVIRFLVPGSTAYPDGGGAFLVRLTSRRPLPIQILFIGLNLAKFYIHKSLVRNLLAWLVLAGRISHKEVLSQNASIKVEAYADTGKGLKSVGASVYSEVLAASTGTAEADIVYDVRGYGDVKASDVVRFKN